MSRTLGKGEALLELKATSILSNDNRFSALLYVPNNCLDIVVKKRNNKYLDANQQTEMQDKRKEVLAGIMQGNFLEKSKELANDFRLKNGECFLSYFESQINLPSKNEIKKKTGTNEH
jgi:hypothetical protein